MVVASWGPMRNAACGALSTSMRWLVPIGILGWMVGLFIAHHEIHAGGCMTEARWASQNDEVYDRELEVE